MVLAGGYLAVSLFVAVRFSAPNREPPERTPADAGLEYREVSFESADRVPLEAWWVPPAEGESSRAAVLVHGWGSDKSDEHVIETAPIYAARATVFYCLTFGATEVPAVRGALWVIRRRETCKGRLPG